MSTARKYQPHYTVEDYRQWGGDWELWYGTAVAMSPSPFGAHERAVTALAYQIQNSIRIQQCDCCVYTGLDWIVQSDTVVRPDVMVVCGDQPERHLEKPPCLTIEILSESTADKDIHAKRELYEKSKVGHYLIVDTAVRSIRWFELQANDQFEDVSRRVNDGIFSVSLSDGCELQFDRKTAFV